MNNSVKEKKDKKTTTLNYLKLKMILHYTLIILLPYILIQTTAIYLVFSIEDAQTDILHRIHMNNARTVLVAISILAFLMFAIVLYGTIKFIITRIYRLKIIADSIDMEINKNKNENNTKPFNDKFSVVEGFIFNEKNSINSIIEKLEDALPKAKELNDLKSKFVTVISHQMRTPLSAGRWNLELLKENLKTNRTNTNLVEDAYENILQSIKVIDDMVMVLDIENKRLNLNNEATDPVEMINALVDKMRKQAVEKNIDIKVKTLTEIPRIDCDCAKMGKIVTSLIENAICYNKGNNEIEITLKIDGNDLICSIKDQGVGIEEGDKHKIGQKFFRGAKAPLLKPDGLGVNLFIAKYFIEKSGGKLWFKSNKNKGTIFSFSLPIKNDKMKKINK